MIYQKYFKTGQKVQLRAKQPKPPEGRREFLSATLKAGDANHFDLRLPYGTEAVKEYPFVKDMAFELSANAMGLGIKVTVTFLKALTANSIRVLVLPDLQMFQHRDQPRLDCTVGVRFTRGRKSLHSLRKTWEKNASILSAARTPPPLKGFSLCRLNLSSTGIRFALQAPAESADICLMLLDLKDGKAPVCALAEIIWVSEQQDDGTQRAGMQFIEILEQDQKRISVFIREHS